MSVLENREARYLGLDSEKYQLESHTGWASWFLFCQKRICHLWGEGKPVQIDLAKFHKNVVIAAAILLQSNSTKPLLQRLKGILFRISSLASNAYASILNPAYWLHAKRLATKNLSQTQQTHHCKILHSMPLCLSLHFIGYVTMVTIIVVVAAPPQQHSMTASTALCMCTLNPPGAGCWPQALIKLSRWDLQHAPW